LGEPQALRNSTKSLRRICRRELNFRQGSSWRSATSTPWREDSWRKLAAGFVVSWAWYGRIRTVSSSAIWTRMPAVVAENSRRVHNGQLSRSIAIYRFFAGDFSGARGRSVPGDQAKRTPAPSTPASCRINSFCQFASRWRTVTGPRSFREASPQSPRGPRQVVAAIRDGIETLSDDPFIGRRIAGEIREIVISFSRTGYVALYRYLPAQDVVRVLAICHQRAIGYPE